MIPRFFITGLPRSRTLWFAKYFTGLGMPCQHELLNQCTSREQFYNYMDTIGGGNSDCGLFLTDFQERWPFATTLIIHRPIDEVADSLARLKVPMNRLLLSEMEEINLAMRGMHVEYDSINMLLPKIHRYLTPTVKYNQEYATTMINTNIQLDVITGNPEAMAIWL